VPTVQEHAAGGDQGALSRIHETRGGPGSLRWFWSMTVNGPMMLMDRVATLEEVQAEGGVLGTWKAGAARRGLVDRAKSCRPVNFRNPQVPGGVGDQIMLRIRDEILDCVIYLYRSAHEAEEGINNGGSGFMLAVGCDREIPNANHLYAVTNKHVIAAGATCVRLNTQEGGKLVVEATKQDWICSR
jgi:hypothetical protein